MARISGRRGAIYVGLASSAASAEPVAFLNKWSLDLSSPTIDVTAFQDENKVSVADLPEGGGSYEGFYDTASDQLYDAATDGAPRKLYLYPTTDDTGVYFYGTAVFDMTIDTAVDGAVAISGSLTAASPIRKKKAS